MPSKIDARRLRDGASAASLPEPKTVEEIQAQLEVLGDGIAAMQSLDDLGSPEANQQAWDDMCALSKRYEELKARLV